MKNVFRLIFFTVLLITQSGFAQETEQEMDSVAIVKSLEAEKIALAAQIAQAEKEAKAAEKAEKAAERAEKKADNALKKAEKKEKRLKDLKVDIQDKKKDIAKRESNINDMTEDMARDKIKGKLSPNDIEKINGKIEKEKLRILKDKEKLKKLEKKI